MRRSTVWFLIAGLWAIVVLLGLFRGQGRQMWLQGVVAATFLVIGLIHRSREAKQVSRRPIR